MSAPFEKWEDPIPAPLFSPGEETVRHILEEANKTPIRPAAHRRRTAFSAAALALLIVGAALGVRFMQTMWGERALTYDSIPPAQPQAAQDLAMMEGVSDPLAGPEPQEIEGADFSESLAIPDTADTIGEAADDGYAGKATAPPVSGASTQGAQGTQGVQIDLLSPEQLVNSADLIVAGRFEEGGLFVVEEVIKGDAPSALTLPDSGMRGWALLFVSDTQDGYAIALEPGVFRQEGNLLSARDKAGAPMPRYDALYPGLTMEGLRAICE